MEYKIYDEKSYRIHTIKTDKFKSCSMEIMYRNKLDKDKITENNLVTDILIESSKKYPKKRELHLALENLYNAHFRGVTVLLGNSFLLSFTLDFLNPKYCDEGYLEEVLKFPFEVLQNPNIDENGFDERSINIRKNNLKSYLESIKESPSRYAIRQSLLNMDPDSPSSYSTSGYLEDLDNITRQSLVNSYNDILENYTCDIYVIGNLDMDEVVKIIKKNFKNKSI